MKNYFNKLLHNLNLILGRGHRIKDSNCFICRTIYYKSPKIGGLSRTNYSKLTASGGTLTLAKMSKLYKDAKVS